MAHVDSSGFPYVLNAVLADCPYELYWFDKTQGYSYGWRGSKLSVNLIVASAYSPGHADGGYEYDTSLGQAVQAAAKKARNIVSSNSDKTDYEKLLAYKNEICDLTDYNYSPAPPMATPGSSSMYLTGIRPLRSSVKVIPKLSSICATSVPSAMPA